ncbi:MAG: penicillin-binding protein 2 [Patescibacteria group bacterium]
MASNTPQHGLFGWSRDGVGLSVSRSDSHEFEHETLFEDDVTYVKDKRVFLGSALPASRFIVAAVVLFLVVGTLVGRAFWMQVVNGGVYQAQAESNRLRHDVVPATRGIIRDRNGVVLAENVPSFDLQVTPWLLPKDTGQRTQLLANVGLDIGMSLDQINAAIASSTDPTQAMTLRRDVPYDRAVATNILLGDNPALHIVTGMKRYYPLSSSVESLSHVLGYVGSVSPTDIKQNPGTYRQTDVTGKVGIEASYEDALRGKAGQKVYEVDALNKVTTLEDDTPPTDGKDVQLTLDANLQKAAEVALKKELDSLHLARGSAIAMNPQDGSILAIVSLPAYNDNDFSGTVSSTVYKALVSNPDNPLLPRAWAGVYPSGSTVKSVVATAALAEHVITPETTVDSVGGLRVGGTFFPDWKAGGHGITNVRYALAWSVNSFFYTVGGGYQSFVGLGVDRLTAWMRKFGLGAKMGIDVPDEAAGFVPSKEWKQQTKGEPWYVGDTYNLSIGQGDLLVTPLQDAVITAEVANGGHTIQPHLVAQPGVSYTSSTLLADAADIQTVRLGLRDTVTYGSGKALSTFPIPVAGKTGTAQWRSDKANHAWFTAFAPFDAPEIQVTVMIEEGGEGSTTAIPVTRDILQAWYDEKEHPGSVTSTAMTATTTPPVDTPPATR